MPTVYLHIGTPKTGTSAIQKFMADNREVLEKQGYCYPNISSKLRYPKVAIDRNAHFLVKRSLEKSEERRKKETAQWHAVGYDMIGEYAQQFENIVLSEERIWYYCNQVKDFWPDLIRHLEKYNCKLKLVVYLRRQDLLIQSLWSQLVKAFTMTTGTFDECINSGYFKYFPLDYYKQLKRLEGYVGKENLLVRAYERGQFEGTDQTLYSDFMQTIGLSLTKEYTIPELTVNPGLNGNFLEIKRWMNDIPQYRESVDCMCMAIRKASVYQEEKDQLPKMSMFQPGEQEKFLHRYAESNRMVAEEYLGRADGILYRQGLKQMPTWKFEEEKLTRDLLVTFTEVICEQEEKIKLLTEEVKEMRQEVDAVYRSVIFRGYRKIRDSLKRQS